MAFGFIKKLAKAAVNPIGTVAGALGAPASVQAALNPVGFVAGKVGGAVMDKVDGGGGGAPGGPEVHDIQGDKFGEDRTRNLAFQDQLMKQAGDAGHFAAPTIQTQNVAAPTQVNTQQVGPVSVSDAQGQEIRQRQLGGLDTLQAAANGTAPSVAQAQLHDAVGGITRQGLGMAAQARGADAASARRAAIMGGAAATGKAALDSSLVRANEMATARGQLTGALSDVRGTDTSVAAKNADLNIAGQTTNANNQGVNDRFNSGQTTDVLTGNANRDVGVQGANATNALGANAQNVNEKQGFNDAILRGSGQVGTATGAQGTLEEQELKRISDYHAAGKDANAKMVGGAIGGGATVGAALLSDRRTKKNIGRDSARDRRAFLGALKSFHYEYKGEHKAEAGDGEFHGGMAQDLEKTKIGRQFVETGADGLKRVKATRFEMALAGAVADELRSR